MDISDRKKKILQVVVDDYIVDVEPVSSKKVKERHLQELSSATIRSELAALEELGFLGQPHTSAGRVPLPKAYRYYVDKIMETGSLTRQQINHINNHISGNLTETENLVKSAAKIISELTNYTGIGINDGDEEEFINNIKLVKLSEKTVLLVIVTESKVLKDSIINLSTDIDEIYIDTGANILQSVFCGKGVTEAANFAFEDIINQEYDKYRLLFENVLSTLNSYISARGEADIVMEGTTKMLQYPEFNDIEKAKKFLTIVDSKSKLVSMLKSGKADSVKLSIKIGADNPGDITKDFSFVTANYSVEGKNIGSAGVIGPIRMEYGKVVSVLECIRDTLDNILKK